jgi:hypothetical protein
MSHILIPKETEGGRQEAVTSDDDTHSLLIQILMELKKMNIHLESMTDEEVDKNDIDME